jgi:hypothetical protein
VVRDDRTHLEDDFGAVETPASTGDVHAVIDQAIPGSRTPESGATWAACPFRIARARSRPTL